MFKNKIDKKGFTLIEMMVAVSIFVIVAFIVVSTLLTMSYAYKKAQKMRLIMDNFNFSLQAMSLGIREGINYQAEGCADGTCFGFTPNDAYLNPNPAEPISDVCYSLGDMGEGKGAILKCSESCPCPVVEANRFTSSDINVTNLNFKEDTTLAKNKVRILIQGTAGTGREEVEFFIQNTVAQRNPN